MAGVFIDPDPSDYEFRTPRMANHSCSDGGGVYCTDACEWCEECGEENECECD